MDVIVIIALVVGIGGGALVFLLRRGRQRTPDQAQGQGIPAAGETTRQYAAERQAQLSAIAEEKGWSPAAYDHVLRGRINAGMNQEMVLLAWGGPSAIDNRRTGPGGAPVERWVYHFPDGAVQYIWFANGRVVEVRG